MQNEKRKIPYGVINWTTLMRECHFVDNTACIREPEKVMPPVETTVVEVCGNRGYNWFDLP